MAGIQTAIKNMKRSQSPGPDGYPAERYKIFMDDLSPILFHLFKNREALISLQHTLHAAYISLP